MIYQIQYDGGEAIVEDESMELAIQSWRKAMVAEYDWDGDEDPDIVTALSSVCDIIIGGEVV